MSIKWRKIAGSYFGVPSTFLTHAEEIELSRGAKSGNEIMRNQLIESYIPFACRIASEWCRRSGRSDASNYAYSIAFLALIHTVDSFDPDKGFRMTTYLGKSIKNTLIKEFISQYGIITVPAYARDIANSFRKGEPPSTANQGRNLAEISDLVDHALSQTAKGQYGAKHDKISEIESPPSIYYDDLLLILDKLPAIEAEIIRARHLSDKPEHYKFLCLRLGMKRSSINRLEAKALKTLRSMIT